MIAVVVPTIRPEKMKVFMDAWFNLFWKHKVFLFQVNDGKDPYIYSESGKKWRLDDLGKISDLIYNFNDGVRNFAFAIIARYYPEIDIIISLDDDVKPVGDPIQDHLDALKRRVPVSWLSTASEYTRGFPYGIRDEAEVVLSHGVWEGVADWDASTQLVKGNQPVEFYKGSIPKGCLFPLCAMNFAFKRKLLPYIYQAPMFGDLNRFADIWGGIEAKKDIDRLGWAAVTGYSTVKHDRASNVFNNLVKEAKGIKLNENYGLDDYFELFFNKRKRWIEWIKKHSGKN